MTPFMKTCVGMIHYLAGTAVGSFVGTFFPGYFGAIVSVTMIAVILLFGPRFEVWLIESGWI